MSGKWKDHKNAQHVTMRLCNASTGRVLELEVQVRVHMHEACMYMYVYMCMGHAIVISSI